MNNAEADQLSHLYQDRAWNDHKRYLKDPTLTAGDKDQEMSVSICEKAFGKSSSETIYKLATLALIYSDMNLKDKSDDIFNRIVSEVGSDPKFSEAGWFVYAMLCRAEASRHDYDAASKAFERGRSLTADATKIDRISEEFVEGLQQGNPSIETDLKTVSTLLKNENFDELDKLSEKFVSEKTSRGDGRWLSDVFFDTLRKGKTDESQINQYLASFKKWLDKKPKSFTARIALANCYADYAWFARGVGWSDTVSSKGWQLMASRLREARSILDEDPSLKDSCPQVFATYSQIALGQGQQLFEREDYDKLLAQCQKSWPSYKLLDLRTCYYLLPRWYGGEHDWEIFAKQRADVIGGAKGNELYAQMIWDNSRYYKNDLFEKCSQLEWNRIKAGFSQIFLEYPNDGYARAAFVRLAIQAKDLASIPKVLSEEK
jgi:hypothetical protein